MQTNTTFHTKMHCMRLPTPFTSRKSSTSRVVPGHSKPTLFIGPPLKLGGPLLEVMVEIIEPRTMVVFHVMEARRKFLDLME